MADLGERMTTENNIDLDYTPASAGGEKCSLCGADAGRKVEETIFHDDPNPRRHPLTAYVCKEHFNQIMNRQGYLSLARGSHDQMRQRDGAKAADAWRAVENIQKYIDGQRYVGLSVFLNKNLRSIRTALQSCCCQQNAEGWLPIETAPKDGTEILLQIPLKWTAESKDPEEPRIGTGNYTCAYWFNGRVWENRLANWIKAESPRHWRHLPASPSEARMKGDE